MIRYPVNRHLMASSVTWVRFGAYMSLKTKYPKRPAVGDAKYHHFPSGIYYPGHRKVQLFLLDHLSILFSFVLHGKSSLLFLFGCTTVSSWMLSQPKIIKSSMPTDWDRFSDLRILQSTPRLSISCFCAFWTMCALDNNVFTWVWGEKTGMSSAIV